MKLSTLQQTCNTRRTNSFRAPAALESSTVDGIFKSPASFFWLILHTLCCLISLILGFRFSRLVFFLLFSSPYSPSFTPVLRRSTDSVPIAFENPPSFPHLLDHETAATVTTAASAPPNRTTSRVVVGRHGIRIRPWPHPNPVEVMKAHRIIERVQTEQQLQYGIKNPRTVIAVTPTYVRTFQALHLTGVMHSLMLVPYDLVWIIVEAGGVSNETAAVIARSRLRNVHIPFEERMPDSWEARHRMEARMRLKALRIIREQRIDGIVMFVDDSNMHSMELFDEIQSVKWMGAISVGILAHSGNSESLGVGTTVGVAQNLDEGAEENLPVPVQGPACNSSGQLAGWHTFNSLPYMEKSATYIDDGATVLPRKLEWAGFVLNSRMVWREAGDKPEWVRDFDALSEDGDDIESPLALLKDASHVEPLGKCGRKVLLWWLRVEARADSKFPPGWKIDPPLDITVPAKRTPWPDAPPELHSTARTTVSEDHAEKRHRKTGRNSRLRQSSRSKRKHESQMDGQVSEVTGGHGEEK
ncbi:probable beta-1,4-xylosyltransferase IRX14H [Magnolia sinica]|uniref:probable beta-1,4-xylosyltransferase IRX14H n=1 Tax=Magnolia sinica TaxID=86752 RepID=UPI00265B1DD6|nr:probable beta-1,4-xylosyltransferase IRX14H [Magnolia sinica]